MVSIAGFVYHARLGLGTTDRSQLTGASGIVQPAALRTLDDIARRVEHGFRLLKYGCRIRVARLGCVITHKALDRATQRIGNSFGKLPSAARLLLDHVAYCIIPSAIDDRISAENGVSHKAQSVFGYQRPIDPGAMRPITYTLPSENEV